MKAELEKENILCPRCNFAATYRYGRTKAGTPRLICLQCNRQFAVGNNHVPVPERPKCPKCGKKMHLYRRQTAVVRFRCSSFPACRGYKIVQINSQGGKE